MEAVPTHIPECLLIKPKLFPDVRGFFFESYNRKKLAALGIDAEFVQDNHSRSARGVLRGLHYQIEQAQGPGKEIIGREVVNPGVDEEQSGFGCQQLEAYSISRPSRVWGKCRVTKQ